MSHATQDALGHCSRLRDLILQRRGGGADDVALRTFRNLSKAAARAADDAECVALMQSAEQYATDLFSESAHRKWTKGSTSGAYVLRLCILGDLNEFCERLMQADALALGGVAAIHRDGGSGDEVGSPAAEEDRDP
jgi:hypothetical protein